MDIHLYSATYPTSAPPRSAPLEQAPAPQRPRATQAEPRADNHTEPTQPNPQPSLFDRPLLLRVATPQPLDPLQHDAASTRGMQAVHTFSRVRDFEVEPALIDVRA